MPQLPQKKVVDCLDLPEYLDVYNLYMWHYKIGLSCVDKAQSNLTKQSQEEKRSKLLQTASWNNIIMMCVLFKCDMEVEKSWRFMDGTSEATEGGYCWRKRGRLCQTSSATCHRFLPPNLPSPVLYLSWLFISHLQRQQSQPPHFFKH